MVTYLSVGFLITASILACGLKLRIVRVIKYLGFKNVEPLPGKADLQSVPGSPSTVIYKNKMNIGPLKG